MVMTTMYSPETSQSFSHIWFIILLFLIILPVSGADIQNIQSALPQNADVTSSLDITKEWKFQESGVSSNSDSIVTWGGYRPFSCPKEDSRVAERKGDYLSVEVDINHHDRTQTADEHNEWVLSFPDERDMTVTESPPNSIIALSSDDSSDGDLTNNICQMYVWVDPNTRFTVKVSGQANKGIVEEAGCTPSYMERQASMQSLVRSETVRLSNLVYNRLKGEDTDDTQRDYGELIWTLRYYLPSQFGKYSDEVLYKALVINETGVLGPDRGVTYALKDNMMRDIGAFRDSFSKEIPDWQGRLVDEAGQNVIGKEIEDAMGIMDIAQSYLTVIDAGVGYESGIALPEFGPIYGLLGMYHDLEKKMRFYRDNIVIPDIADEIYFRYKENRAAQKSPVEAFDDAIYENARYYELRSSPVFERRSIKDLDLVLAERFEQRYHTEELLDLRSYKLEHYDLFVKGIMWQYHEKLDRLERTCQGIVDGKIQVDIPYQAYKVEKWWYLPNELRGN